MTVARVAWQERRVIAPDSHHGEPCIGGTRIPVAMFVGSLADGMTPSEIEAAHPQLSDHDIRAALSYAAELTRQDVLVPLLAWEVLVRVKVDEDLPSAATQLLRGHGFDTLSVVEQGMGGFKDLALWSAVYRPSGGFWSQRTNVSEISGHTHRALSEAFCC